MKKSGFKLRSSNAPQKLNIDIFGIGRAIGEKRRRKWQKEDEEKRLAYQELITPQHFRNKYSGGGPGM